MISVLLPSRGRPGSLFRAASSFARGNAEVVVGLDNDDPTLPEAVRLLSTLPVRVVTNPRHESLPALQNALAREARGDFLLPVPDDYEVDRPDWVERVEAALRKLPSMLGVVYLHDPLYPGFTTFPVVPRRVVAMQGFLMAPFFPFLFTDTWWNEVAILSGFRIAADVSVSIIGETGHQHRYRDLPLWAGLFEALRPMRIELARRLWEAAALDRHMRAFLDRAFPTALAACERIHACWRDPAFIARVQGMGEFPETPAYRELARRARAALPKLQTLQEAA